MDAKTDPEMATALLVAKEEARVEEVKKASEKTQKEAVKLAAKIPSIHDTTLATETAAIQLSVDQTTKVALSLQKNMVNVEEAIRRFKKEKIEAAIQAEKTQLEAQEIEMKMEIVKLEAEKARDALVKIKNIADMPSAQRKSDEADLQEAELLRAQQLQRAAKARADRDLLERNKKAAAAEELAKRTRLAKEKADRAKAQAEAAMAAKAAKTQRLIEEAKRKAALLEADKKKRRDINRLLPEQAKYLEKKDAEIIETQAAAFCIELKDHYLSDNLASVIKYNNTAKKIKTDLTAAIGHADIAYELAK